MSAATVTEALIVSMGRGTDAEMAEPIDTLASEIVSVTPASARRAAQAYGIWGNAGILPV